MPAEHDGKGLFRFELRFSEDFRGLLDYKLLRDEAFRVTNGIVRQAGRVEPGQNRRWRIAVRPGSDGNVTVELPATTDCDAAGAVCVDDGRPLSRGASETVVGPAAANASAQGLDLLQGPLAARVTPDGTAHQPLPVVASRTTTVAAHVRHGVGGRPPEVRVRVVLDAEVLDIEAELHETLDAVGGSAGGEAAGAHRTSVYVATVPGALARAEATVSVRVDPDDVVVESDETDNELAVALSGLRVANVPAFRVRVVPLTRRGEAPLVAVRDHGRLFAETLALLPIGAHDTATAPAMQVGDTTSPREMLDRVLAAWNRDAEPDEFYHGLYRAPYAAEGLALVGGRVAVSPIVEGEAPASAEWAVAHGMAHNFGVDDDAGPAVETAYGWSSASGRFFSPVDQEIMHPPGGPTLFISPEHYDRALGWMRGSAFGAATADGSEPATVTAAGSVALSGGIDAAGAWYLHSAGHSPQPARAASAGSYRAVLYGDSGMPLLERPVACTSPVGGCRGWLGAPRARAPRKRPRTAHPRRRRRSAPGRRAGAPGRSRDRARRAASVTCAGWPSA